MTTMSISLTEDLMEFVEAQISRGTHASVSEYLCALLREEQRRRAKQELEAKFHEALDSGPAEPMIREDWDTLAKRVKEGVNQEL